MDLHSTPEVELSNGTPQMLPHNPSQMQLHQMSLTHQLSHQNHSPELECRHYYKCREHLSNGKAPKYEADLFLHVEGLLYKHVMDSNKKFLALVIPKAKKYTALVEAHDKLGHQGATQTYCLIKCQYYSKDMNKDIQK